MYDGQKFSEDALTAARNATGWVCPDCGELALLQTGYCKVCGKKPMINKKERRHKAVDRMNKYLGL